MSKLSIKGSVFILALTEECLLDMKINTNPGSDHCYVSEIKEDGQADKAGFKVRDMLYSFPTDGVGVKGDFHEHLTPVKLAEISEWTTTTRKPNILAIERFDKDPTMVSRKNVCKLLSDRLFPRIPFCTKCNAPDSDAPHHHTLCPKHHGFGHSGAKDKITVLLAGFRDGCLACSFHLTNGKKCPWLKHNDKCCSSTRRGRVNSMEKLNHSNETRFNAENKGLSTSGVKEEAHSNKCCSSTRIGRVSVMEKLNHSNETRFNAENKGLSTSGDKTEEGKGIHIAFGLDQKEERVMIQLPEKIAKKDEEPSGVYAITPPKVHTSYPSKANPVMCTVLASSRTANPMNESHDCDVKNDKSAAFKWTPCPNPWGDYSHREGDYVLTSPLGACMNIIPNASKCFVNDPFAKNSTYHQSHVSPEAGCKVLQLTRDPSALRSWGFSFKHHEFGGACIISNVEPLSPAGSAVRQFKDACLIRQHTLTISASY